MSNENFNEHSSNPDEPDDWLDQWESEQKLNPHDAHEMLRKSFAERLDEWRRNHPDENS